jgi:histidyl-tRNA synthetase
MFRKERPQSGRMRQFQQIGLEMFGYDAPEADYEVISIFTNFFTMLGLKNLSLKVNSMGCRRCRSDYISFKECRFNLQRLQRAIG